jgi:hypothetical protein
MKWIILGTVCLGPICHDGRPYDDRFVSFKQCTEASAYYAAHPDPARRRWERFDRCEQVRE